LMAVFIALFALFLVILLELYNSSILLDWVNISWEITRRLNLDLYRKSFLWLTAEKTTLFRKMLVVYE
jgi:hypothetical protein